MKLSVSETQGKLTDRMRRVGEGEEVILTRHGCPLPFVGDDFSKTDLASAL